MTTKRDRMNADFAKVKARRNDRPVKTKDIAPVGKPKVRPTGSPKKPGVKVTWKF